VAAGEPVRELAAEPPEGFAEALPKGFPCLRMPFPGILVIQAPLFSDAASGESTRQILIRHAENWLLGRENSLGNLPRSQAEAEALRSQAHAGRWRELERIPLWILGDDAEFSAQSLDNWLWSTFTRVDPAADSDGLFAFAESKHWGCLGPWVLDARRKPRHAPQLDPDAKVEARIEAMAALGGPLEGLI
jgi:4-hydroxy-3-polyprenylbenzoate decarboxylase